MAYYNFTKAQWEKLESAYRELLEHNPESNEANKLKENPENIREIMLDAIENYIAIYGSPSFEDCYIIISC